LELLSELGEVAVTPNAFSYAWQRQRVPDMLTEMREAAMVPDRLISETAAVYSMRMVGITR